MSAFICFIAMVGHTLHHTQNQITPIWMGINEPTSLQPWISIEWHFFPLLALEKVSYQLSFWQAEWTEKFCVGIFNIAGDTFYWDGILENLCGAMISATIMVKTMLKNIIKNVQ